MKIGLEASRANKEFKTGTEWYAWHLLQQFKKLPARRPVCVPVCVPRTGRPRTGRSLGAGGDQDNEFIVYHNVDLAKELAVAPANFLFKQIKWPFRKLWTHICLSWELLRHPVDKLFFSNAVPFITRGEVTATIHDLGFMRNPELYHPLERIYQRLSHTLAINRADKILAISEATKQDIIEFFPKAVAKIKVIYNGWDADQFKPISSEQKIYIRDKYNLPENYLLYIGRVETKKNIQNLIKGYKLIHNKQWPLVLAGRPGNYGYEEIKQLAREERQIIFLGYVSQEDYQLMIAAAGLFVFPSKFEGFGIPVLEAMGSGVPVACSNIPVLKEVSSHAARYFNPDDSQNIADVLEKLMVDENARQELVRLGLDRSKQFSWEICAQQTLDYILS